MNKSAQFIILTIKTVIVMLVIIVINSVEAKTKFADLVILNGSVFTANKMQPSASAVAISNGIIIAVGNNKNIAKYIGTHTQTLSLDGQMLLPGFIDTHNHIFEGASEVGGNCELDKNSTLHQQAENLENCLHPALKKGQWIIGHGHQLDTLMSEESDLNPRQFLDQYFPNNPVIIMEESSHSMLINSLGLTLAGIDANSNHPPGGRIMFDPFDGKPNGILFDNAGDIVMEKAWNSQTNAFQKSYQGLLNGINQVTENGITSVGDGRLYWRRGWYKVWQKALNEEALTLRVSLRPWLYPEVPMAQQLDFLESIYDPDPASSLIVDQVKLYSDGVLHFGTAKMKQPYLSSWQSDSPYGLNYIPPKQLTRWLKSLDKIGYGAHIHAVGDAGVEQALNAIQLARKNGSEKRYGLTHLELVDKSDIKRFKKLGVDADFQAGADVFGEHKWAEHLIAKHRIDRLQPMRNIFDTGANITFSSDWTVNPLNPLVAIANSLRLNNQQGLPDIDKAIYAATLNGAKALGLSEVTGSIELGKFADFVVLDRDITQLTPAQIKKTQIMMTIFQGEIVFSEEDSFGTEKELFGTKEATSEYTE